MGSGQCEAVLKPPRGLQDTRTTAGMNDGQLLARFTACRDELAEIAFAALVRRHGPMVLRVCEQVLGDRHTAEDAFQATFLVLARRADSIRQPELLGNWLYGVALRTARGTRLRDHRRRQRESPRAEGIGVEPIDELGRPDLSMVCREELEALHEEVSQLPEKYRAPVVLCELEGLTYQEAAQRLRCPVGTIGVRLRRAREQLRERLTRRGLAPTAGLIGGALVGADVASASVPWLLVESTVQAAMGFAATPVVTLSEGVLAAMALIRLKVAALLVLAIGITATVAWVGTRRDTTVMPAPEQAKPQSRAEAPPLRNPTASLSAGRTAPAPKTGAEAKVASPMPDALFALNRKWAEIAEDLHLTEPKPKTRLVQAGLVRSPRDELAWGEVLFVKEWVPKDPMSHGGDGLGPVYNDTSCVACHGLGASGGAGPESKNVVLVTATSTGQSSSAKALNRIHPGFRGTRSVVLHRYGTESEYGTWRREFFESHRVAEPNASSRTHDDSIEARIQAAKLRTVPDSRLRERLARLKPANGFTLSVAERNTPALFGTGRIDAIPSEVLIAMAESQPAAVRGRISRTGEGGIGKFGWKGQIASLHEFVRGACANEMGLEVPGFSQAISPLDPNRKATGLDMTDSECDALVAYVRALPVPVVVDPTGPRGTRDIREGRRHFADLGCTQCHTPTLGDVNGIYSDLLLHEMGQSLSDSGTYYGSEGPDSPGGPSPGEWRTPPLWGYRDSGPYLHDGRAQNLEEAVALHEGQAETSAHGFFALTSIERFQVEAFLKSLVAPPAAGKPGVVLAAYTQSRHQPEEPRVLSEARTRQQREQALARDQEQWREVQRQQKADEDAKRAEEAARRAKKTARRARGQLSLAQALEKMDKITGALDFYREITREAAGTKEGRLAAARIEALSNGIQVLSRRERTRGPGAR
jgi:RNA polymerase sigma factor (sigma-70 family)